LARAASRRPATVDPAVELYLAQSAAFAATVGALPDDSLDATTANGLTARELVVHVAAQESLLAQLVGTPTLDAVRATDIGARTAAALVELADQPLDVVVAAWRAAVEANRRWALGAPTAPAATTGSTEWQGVTLSSHDAIVVRAFETWVHDEDLRQVLHLPPRAPEPHHLALMTDLAGRSLGLSLGLAGRRRPGRTARLVLTGAGGGEWLVAMGGDEPVGAVDVTVIADAVEWCRLVGDRTTPDALRVDVEGDRALAEDLLASASALATL
jgi:uncharacterized protein (TIGR03083 family)